MTFGERKFEQARERKGTKDMRKTDERERLPSLTSGDSASDAPAAASDDDASSWILLESASAASAVVDTSA